MDWTRLRRRGLLGGTAAALAGLAGCNDTSRTTDTDPADTEPQASVTDSDTGDVTQDGIPEHGHSGPDDGGTALAPERVDAGTVAAAELLPGSLAGVVNVTSYPGDDLGERWNNAVEAQGQVDKRVWWVPPGEYRLTTPVDLTGNRFEGIARSVGIACRGAFISLETDGRPAFDVSDVGGLRADFGYCLGHRDRGPNVGLVVGDRAPHGGPEGKFITGVFNEYYTTAAVYVHGREHVTISDARLWNAAAGGHVLAVSPNNALEIGEVGDGELVENSAVQHLVVRASKLFGTNPDGASVCYLEGSPMGHTVIQNTEITTGGPPCFDIDLSREDGKDLTLHSIRGRTWRPADPDSAAFLRLRDGGRGSEYRGITMHDIRHWGVNGDGDYTEPFVRASGGVSVADLHMSGQTELLSNGDPGFEFANDLTGATLRTENKRTEVGGDFTNSRVRGQFSPEGFGLSVAGETRNVLYWSEEDARLRMLGGTIG